MPHKDTVVSVQHRNCFWFTQKHIVFGQKSAKNQKLAQIGRRATVLSIWTGEIDATGLPEPLGLFLDPKTTNKKKIAPLAPLLGGSPSGQVALVD